MLWLMYHLAPRCAYCGSFAIRLARSVASISAAVSWFVAAVSLLPAASALLMPVMPP
jgi:hypothetical protein